MECEIHPYPWQLRLEVVLAVTQRQLSSQLTLMLSNSILLFLTLVFLPPSNSPWSQVPLSGQGLHQQGADHEASNDEQVLTSVLISIFISIQVYLYCVLTRV